MNAKGSVLIESSICCFICLVAIIFVFELCRRAQFEVLLHHIAFSQVRARALGAPNTKRDQRSLQILRGSFGAYFGKEMWQALGIKEKREGVGRKKCLVVRVHYRFPSLIQIEEKNHFEMTRKCKFFF